MLVLNAIVMGVLVAFVALGYSLLYGVLRVINFAHTDVIAVAGYVCFLVAKLSGGALTFPGALLICLAAGGVFGIVCAAIVFAPFGRKAPLESLLASFCVSLAVRALLSLFFGSATRAMPLTLAADVLHARRLDVLLASIAIVIIATLGYAYSHTIFGLALRACGSDAEQVASMGYPAQVVAYGAFVIAGALGGLTAIPIGLANGIAPDIGNMYGLWAFAATILGGLGRLKGTLAAGLILGAALTIAARFFSPLLVNSVVFALMAIVLATRPQGLMGFVTRKV